MNDLATIESKPLELVVAWLYHQLKNDTRNLDASAMAVLARRLIAAEVAPGGPYRNEAGVIDESLNRSIGQLFSVIGIRLKGLEEYLKNLDSDDRWPMAQRDALERSPALTAIQKKAADYISEYSPALRRKVEPTFRRILKTDAKGEISRITELFATSLPNLNVDYVELGVANLLVWTAYTIFDGIIDGGGNPSLLPAASAANRDAIELFGRQVPSAFKEEVRTIMRGMDEANAWELARCRFTIANGTIHMKSLPRFGSYEMIAKRSAGHVLGPLIVAYRAGLSRHRLMLIKGALYDYLIARQFDDDLHDWVDDFERGQISPVVAFLLKEAGIQKGQQSLDGSLHTMRTAFWRVGLTRLCGEALSFVIRSKERLVASGVFADDALFISEILTPLEVSLNLGNIRHERDKEFYETYRRSRPAK